MIAAHVYSKLDSDLRFQSSAIDALQGTANSSKSRRRSEAAEAIFPKHHRILNVSLTAAQLSMLELLV